MSAPAERGGRGRTAAAAVALVVAGVLARAAWAPHPGYLPDTRWFHRWAAAAHELRTGAAPSEDGEERRLGHVYRDQPDLNYPPLYVEVLSFLPAVHAATFGRPAWSSEEVSGALEREDADRRTGRASTFPPDVGRVLVVLKAPAMAADLAIALLLFLWVRARASRARALTAGALWALNPYAIYLSAWFGQVDSLHTGLLLGALMAAQSRRLVLTGALAALAVLTKMQAVVVLPALAVAAWAPRSGASARARLGDAARAAAGAAGAALAVLAPFALAGTLGDVAGAYTGSVGDDRYARTTVAAWNLWWLFLEVPASDGLRAVAPRDDVPLLLGATARQLGLALYGAFTLVVCWVGARRDTARAAFASAALLALGFFLFPTEMKARYGYPAIPLLLPLVACGRRWAVLAAVLSAGFWLNALRVQPLEGVRFLGLAGALDALSDRRWMGHAVAAVLLLVLAVVFVDGLLRRGRETGA